MTVLRTDRKHASNCMTEENGVEKVKKRKNFFRSLRFRILIILIILGIVPSVIVTEMVIANYEDRFVIPTSHREMAGDAFAERNGCGFTFGDGCHGSDSKFNLFNSSRIDAINITEVRDKAEGE